MSTTAHPTRPGTVDEPVLLPAPTLSLSITLDGCLRARQSHRQFGAAPLSGAQVSALLWAAFGINRPATGGRTAPSAHGWQEIDVYAVTAEGSFRYEPQAHSLHRVSDADLRAATGTQDFVATAPLNLVYVADFSRMDGSQVEERPFLAGADAGFIAQNVYLYCAGTGLHTVVRGLIDRPRLAALLALGPTQRVALAQTVGHPPGP